MAARRPPPPHVDPWAGWHLDGNPFRRLEGGRRLASLIVEPGDDWLEDPEEVMGRAERVIQFVGSMGTGKTTHLRSLLTSLNEWRAGCGAFQYLPPGADRLEPMPAADVWIVDEAQRLRRSALQTLLREIVESGRRLIFSSHEDLSRPIARAGLSIHTVWLKPVGGGRIAAFFDRRVALARCGDGGFAIELADGAVAELDRYAAGDLNRAEELLYQLFQRVILPRRPQGVRIEATDVKTVRRY